MAIKNIKTPASVARSVMERCPHNILCGDGALQWALDNGFQSTDILSTSSHNQWKEWKRDIKMSTPLESYIKDLVEALMHPSDHEKDSHDTVGVICLDKFGHLAAGTSTSG